MYQFRKSAKKGSSRQQIDISGVKDDILILNHNRYRIILEVSAINFELKSESEQDAIIDTYQSFLNSLSSPLQLLIRTREIDIDKHLIDLRDRLDGESQPIYLEQIESYHDFLRGLVKTNKILSRRFYIVVPFEGRSNSSDFHITSEQLNLNADIVAKGLGRLGMHSRRLSSVEILDLFYSYYNPVQAKLQPISLQTMKLLHSSFIRGKKI